MNWYCIRTEQKREHLVVRHLRMELGIDAYCPRISCYKATRTGRRVYIDAMFPCYSFVKVDLGIWLQRIIRTRGVISVVRRGDSIPIVPPAFIDTLRAELNGDLLILEPPTLSFGDSVQILHGPFTGMVGQIREANSGSERVKILLEILGSEASLLLPRASIRSLPFTNNRGSDLPEGERRAG